VRRRLQSRIAGIVTTDPAAALAAGWPGFQIGEDRPRLLSTAPSMRTFRSSDSA
jgi:hypothetical protein